MVADAGFKPHTGPPVNPNRVYAVSRIQVERVAPATEAETRARLARAKRIVIKVGSNVLVGGSANLIDRHNFCAIVETIARLAEVPGRHIVLVTSGAVAVGRRSLASLRRPDDGRTDTLSAKQALAAIGQPKLMHLYGEEFAFYGKQVAQVLLTRDDIANRERFLNARITFREMELVPAIIPIVNENDTVATEELRFGDNDQLAGLLTSVVGADLLIILSDVSAVFDADPTRDAQATPIPVAYADDASLLAIAGPTSQEGPGTGGMASKIRAARIAAGYGVPTIIGPGRELSGLGSALSGSAGFGTLLVPRDQQLGARKSWIKFGSRPSGVVSVDAGAERALRELGKSLLPSGLLGVSGDFTSGAAVDLQNEAGNLFARGLVAYSASELRRLRGLRSEQIAETLGYSNGDAVIHRDDLVLLDEPGAAGSIEPSED